MGDRAVHSHGGAPGVQKHTCRMQPCCPTCVLVGGGGGQREDSLHHGDRLGTWKREWQRPHSLGSSGPAKGNPDPAGTQTAQKMGRSAEPEMSTAPARFVKAQREGSQDAQRPEDVVEGSAEGAAEEDAPPPCNHPSPRAPRAPPGKYT